MITPTPILTLSFTALLLGWAASAHAGVIELRPNNLGLVGYWSFNEGTSTHAGDFSGKGNIGTLSGMANPPTGTSGWGNGKFGKALSFDEINDLVSIASPNALPLGDTSRTVSVWFKLKKDLIASTDSALVQYGTAANGNMFSLITSVNNPGKLYFYGHNADISGANLLKQNVWNQAVVTYDTTTNTLTMYLNGVQDGQGVFGAGLNTIIDSNGLTIGNRPGSSFWNGQLDDVRIYNRALSADEVKTLYQGSKYATINTSSASLGTGSLKHGLVGHWTFDGQHMDTTSARDTSGQDNTGWLMNGPRKVAGKLGQALEFNGSAGAASSTNVSFVGLSQQSISAWIYPRSAGQGGFGRIVHKGAVNPGLPSLLLSVNVASVPNNSLRFESQFDGGTSGTWATATDTIVYNTWTHVAVTFVENSANDPVMYINGVPVSVIEVTAPSGTPTFDDSHFSIGNRYDGIRTFDGRIDEVRYYNRTLSSAESIAAAIPRYTYSGGYGGIRLQDVLSAGIYP